MKLQQLIYADTAKCPCGKPLAYEKGSDPYNGYWDCSGILDGTADHEKKHTDQLPFRFYKVKAQTSLKDHTHAEGA